MTLVTATAFAVPSSVQQRMRSAVVSGECGERDELIRSFHIGNSLTWDSTPSQLPRFSEQVDLFTESRWHINCGSTLLGVWDNPHDTCIDPTPYGYFQEALQNHQWDLITLQPYGQGWHNSWLSDDLDVIANCIDLVHSNPVNKETEFFVLMGWPEVFPSQKFDNKWGLSLSNPDNPRTTMTRAYFDKLSEQLLEDERFVSEPIYVIPTGYVLAEISRMAQQGAFDEFTGVEQLYRDTWHLTHSLGQFTAALTHYASIYGRGPVVLERPPGSFLASGNDSIFLSDALAKELASVVWHVVRSHPHTKPAICPADISGDDQVGLDDLSIFLVQFRSIGTTASDINRDGIVDVADFGELLISWGQTCE